MIPRLRAWDKEFKEMVQVDALVFDEQIIKATYKNGNVVKEDLKNYVLMQSTGLKDKNGKEIFEGDIVSDGHTKGDIKNHPTLGFYMVDDNGIERWFSDNATIEDFKEDVETAARILEILGNIYTDPELAEVSS
ncbi:YopX family protein [Streptococcus salivarius]|uniref:YopX family protein n=1 Tax=Streptococcus salivarius TaxID=1304 RepID=UPI001581A39B|nr:YopX family protein [Streptococcus salivarius]